MKHTGDSAGRIKIQKILLDWMKNNMRLFTLFLVLFIYEFIFAQKISKIEFEGLKNVKKHELMNKIKSRRGMKFSYEILNEDKQILSETGYFEIIECEFDKSKGLLKFIVKEFPIIEKITFKGNKRFKDSKLKDKISLKKGDFLNYYKIRDDIDSIIQLYSDDGFVDTAVKSDYIIDEKKNKADLIFMIEEGKKFIVENIVIEGAKNISRGTLMRLLDVKKKKGYKKKTVDDGIEKIKSYYESKGFAKMNIECETKTKEDSVEIIIKINEGKKYKFGKIDFKGNKILDARTLKRLLHFKTGKIYNKKNIEETLNSINEKYGDKGYLQVKVSTAFFFTNGNIDITFNISEGPRVYVNEIYIEGNTYTKKRVIEREILIKKDKPLSTSLLRKTMERLYNLGFLDEVNVDFKGTEFPDRADVIFTVSEGKPGMLSAGAGYSTVDQLVGTLQVTHLNLLGLGQRLNLLWEFGGRKQNYEINWTEPYLFGRAASLTLSIYNLTRVRDFDRPTHIFNAYKEQKRGFSARIGPRLTEDLMVTFGYSYEYESVFDIEERVRAGGFLKDFSSINSAFTTQLIYDLRDYIFDPSKGIYNSLLFTLSGGPFLGEKHFYKSVAKFSCFIPTFWKLVLGYNISFGFMDKLYPWMEEERLIPEKFAMGGPDTVRGYHYGEIGRGRYMFTQNIECKFPIVQEKGRTIFQGVIFLDIGGTWERIDDISFEFGNKKDQIRAGIGFGFRFVTPVFPLRFDWGYPLHPSPGMPQALQFYFTLGQMF